MVKVPIEDLVEDQPWGSVVLCGRVGWVHSAVVPQPCRCRVNTRPHVDSQYIKRKCKAFNAMQSLSLPAARSAGRQALRDL